MRKIILLLVAAVFLMPAAEVLAKPLLTMSIKAEKEVIINNEKTMVAADKVESGDVITYVISYVNTGDEDATDANVDDPIPNGTVYVLGSAFGDNADITFSIDGGKTFKKPSLLTYEIKLPNGKTEKKIASPEQYTHVRWTINKISAHGSGQVGFKVKVK